MSAQEKSDHLNEVLRFMPKPRIDGITIMESHETDEGREVTIRFPDGVIEVCRTYAYPTSNKQRAENARTARLLERNVKVVREPPPNGKELQKLRLKEQRERLLKRVEKTEPHLKRLLKRAGKAEKRQKKN